MVEKSKQIFSRSCEKWTNPACRKLWKFGQKDW